MIQAVNISKSFGDLVLYDNLSLTISEGSRIALIAKNGAGKSTLLNIIAGTESADSGEIVFRNDIRVGYLTQEPQIDGSLTVLEAAAHSQSVVATTTLLYHKALESASHEHLTELSAQMDSLSAWDFDSKVKSILTRLKLHDTDQKVSTLSGGQLKRLALATILIDDPDILILDEPTNHLDLEMAEWLEDFLIKCNKTIFMVTHDRYFLERIATDIYEIDEKQVYTYKGCYSRYIEQRLARREQFNTELEKAKNLFKREAEWMRRMPQARSHKSKYRQEEFYKTKDKASARLNDDKVTIKTSSSRLGTKIFEAKDVSKRFGEKIILSGYSYVFARGEKMGIVGKNGTGKSTFLNMLTGLIPPDSGTIDLGESVRIGYYRQMGIQFDEKEKVIDAVKAIAEVVTLGDGSTITASQFLNQFLFAPETQYNHISKLSGGEKRRLYLLTILMRSPNFLILDEPTNDLDILTLGVLEEYLDNFDGCLIVVSHDRYFMDKVTDHLLVFEGDGKIRNFAGNYTQYRNAIEQEAEEERKTNAATTLKTAINSPSAPATAGAKARKLTYKEQRELEALDAEIESLELEKKSIEKLLSSGALTTEQITVQSGRYAELTSELDNKSMRWLELSDI